MNKRLFLDKLRKGDITFVLAKRNLEHIGAIANIKQDSISINENFNSPNEISFTVYKVLDGNEEQYWNDIIDLKLVWVKELNEYFEIKVSINDTDATIKTVTGTSLCEAELGQTELYNIEINTEDDIARDDYVVTKFYDSSNPQGSLLNRVLEKAPHYTIKHVDSSLCNLQRSFSIDGTSIYDFLTGDCAKEFNCLFLFDTTERGIYVYDLYTVCNDCGYRGEFEDVCPECGSTNLKYYGEDTAIFVDKENLTDEVQFETDTDSIKNCFKLEAGDDLMTATIRMLNQNGSDYIYCITDEQKKDMPNELVAKLNAYDKLYDSYSEEYKAVIDNLYEATDKILYYTSEMMPTVEKVDINASTEAAKLTQANMSPTALQSVTSSTSRATVESALKNYAKVYVKSGYVKVDINNSSFTYNGIDSSGNHYGTWTGNFKITNWSDKDDVAYSPTISVKIYDNYQEFVEQKIEKNIAQNNDDEGSVFDVLSIKDLDSFKSSLTLYNLNRLKSFYDAIQGAMDVLIQLDQAKSDANLYNALYVPYYNKLQACQTEIDKRQITVDEWQTKYDTAENKKNEIQKALNFETYLGTDLYKIFCTYRREQKYSNSNYVSDGLDDAQLFENARQFIEAAKKELFKSATRQHNISTTLDNLLVIPEFESITDKFELGNWIRIKADDAIYRLRLIGYSIGFSDLTKLNVTFSDVTKQLDCRSDLNSIINSTQSMATTYDTVTRQAVKGENANSDITKWINEGLNSSLVQIKNNINEEVTVTKLGLIAKEYDDIADDYSPEQLRVTHNEIVMTADGWKTASLAIGKHIYKYYDINSNSFKTAIGYGVTSDFMTAGQINSSSFIGGNIYSSNYSSTQGTHINLNDGTFSFAGGKLVYNASNQLILKDTTIKWDSCTNPQISNVNGLTNRLSGIDNTISDFKKKVNHTLMGSDTTEIGSDYIISPKIGGGYLYIANSNYSVEIDPNHGGSNTLNGYLFCIKKISDNSRIMSVDTSGNGYFNGQIIATSGKIGNFNLNSALYSGTSSITSTTSGIYIGTDGIRQYNSSTQYVNIQNGILTCNGANITGTITATSGSFNGEITASSGTIGNYKITSQYLQSSDQTVGLSATVEDWAFWAGGTTINTAKFRVTHSGALYATKAEISGKITSYEGIIGGWTITNGEIRGGNTSTGIASIQCPNENIMWVFSAGSTNKNYYYSDAPFRVHKNGDLYAKKLFASGGTIGGINIYNNSIGTSNWSLNSDGTATFGQLNIASDGSVDFSNKAPLICNGITVHGGKKTAGLTISSGHNSVDIPPTSTWVTVTISGTSYTILTK